MEWIFVVQTIVILFALWSIRDSLEKIAKKPLAQFPDLSEIEDQLKNIFRIMGGEEKMKEETAKKRKDLHTRLIKGLILYGDTPKEAEAKANEEFEKSEFNETHDIDSIDYSSPTYHIERWVIALEIELRNRNQYGHLLPKAKTYIKGKTEIEKDYDFGLEIDYDGRKWLIEKLIEEKRLKKNEQYAEPIDELINYKVL